MPTPKKTLRSLAADVVLYPAIALFVAAVSPLALFLSLRDRRRSRRIDLRYKPTPAFDAHIAGHGPDDVFDDAARLAIAERDGATEGWHSRTQIIAKLLEDETPEPTRFERIKSRLFRSG